MLRITMGKIEELLVKSYSSPNFNKRSSDIQIDSIVLHHTELPSAESAIQILTDSDNKGYPVSAHYLIEKEGRIYQLVEDKFKAWHAGISYWRGNSGLNNNSIGIELDNTGEEKFSAPLMKILIKLMHHLINKHKISCWNILSHSDIAPGRKVDPSHHFNWKELSEQGIGYFPKSSGTHENLFEYGTRSISFMELQKKLKKFGYKIEITEEFDEQSLSVIQSFNRRYCPETFNDNTWNLWTDDANLKLNELIEQMLK